MLKPSVPLYFIMPIVCSIHHYSSFHGSKSAVVQVLSSNYIATWQMGVDVIAIVPKIFEVCINKTYMYMEY